jgi:hypothetical protein
MAQAIGVINVTNHSCVAAKQTLFYAAATQLMIDFIKLMACAIG